MISGVCRKFSKSGKILGKNIVIYGIFRNNQKKNDFPICNLFSFLILHCFGETFSFPHFEEVLCVLKISIKTCISSRNVAFLVFAFWGNCYLKNSVSEIFENFSRSGWREINFKRANWILVTLFL